MDSVAKSHIEWIGPSEFEDFWNGIWRSPKGKAWASSGVGMAGWLKATLARRPFMVCKPWAPDLQKRHFSLMWGQIFQRECRNDAHHDLYWLHELVHWACVDFEPSNDFAQWRHKWDLDELRASCASEILIHGEVEDWDQDAFGRPVWARRFGAVSGSNPADQSTWSPAAREAASVRLAIRDGLREPANEDERWFAGFKTANEGWAMLWVDDWRRIDAGLEAYAAALDAGDIPAARLALEKAAAVEDFPELPYAAQARHYLGMP